ncbi:MAG TPA: cobalamin biosynthesis protein [Desulfonatronum sp.]|nr:cobalamin biosynthesis protein [Desulfonatronum sp.]
MITLILGGEKSGKSATALEYLQQSPAPHAFVGTAVAQDMEMRRRINAHRKNRPPHIPVRESDVDLARVLRDEASQGGTILVDSLDFWLFSCIQKKQEHARKSDLLELLDSGLPIDLIMVSLEVGLGPLQAAAQSRAFVRSLGLLNQEVAALAQEVLLVVAGQTMRLKGGS